MIWIRADANETIGSGHVMRCLSIADALKRQGQQVCFLTADENAAGLLEARGQAFRVLHTDYRRMEGELEALEELLADGGFFLADSYFVTAAYLDRVRERLPVGYLDDMGRRDLAADLLIDYNIFAEARRGLQCGGIPSGAGVRAPAGGVRRECLRDPGQGVQGADHHGRGRQIQSGGAAP